jgi:hypothetical protein
MRYHSIVLAAAALYGCSSHGSPHTPNPNKPADPILDIFVDNRSLKCHPEPATGPDPAIVARLENSAIGRAYCAIHPERSVLAYDCGSGSKWCGQAPFGFQTVFGEADKLANPNHPNPDGLASAWYASAKCLDKALGVPLPTFPTLDKAPFQLLAVANRMDLAHLEGGNWVGAEIHFAYGLIPDPGESLVQLMVILEFELPIFDRPCFKALAQTWASLSKAGRDQYAIQLVDALRASGLSLQAGRPTRVRRVRSRMNHELAGPWLLSQLVLDPQSKDTTAHTKFAPAKLDDQISKDLAPDSWLNLCLWRKVEAAVRAGQLGFPIPDQLLEKPSLGYGILRQGMGTPPGVCNASEAVRNVLALQQCSWCHTTETKTQFAHLPNRLPQDSSVPSGFLVGKGNNLHPSLTDLYYGHENVVWPVTIPYTTYGGPPSCQTQAANLANAVRKFHDVARRTLFLAAVQVEADFHRARSPAEQFSTSFTE